MDFTFYVYDGWEQIVDNHTGKILVEGRDIQAEDVLVALGHTYDLKLRYDISIEEEG